MRKSNTLSKAEKLDAKLESLEREKQPSRDLWQGIEFEISKPTMGDNNTSSSKVIKITNKPLYGLAASFALVAVVGYFSFQTGLSTSGQDLAEALSAQHQMQKNELIASFEGQQSATQNWQEQISELDEAALAIKKALAEEPNNAALLNMLKKVHEQQISLIEQVHKPAWQQI